LAVEDELTFVDIVGVRVVIAVDLVRLPIAVEVRQTDAGGEEGVLDVARLLGLKPAPGADASVRSRASRKPEESLSMVIV
jgi:hypothetical protein